MNKPVNTLTNETRSREVKENFAHFEKVMPTLVDEHEGRFALLRHRKVIAIFDTLGDAAIASQTFYKDGIFSVQEIRTKPLELSNHRYAVYLGQSR